MQELCKILAEIDWDGNGSNHYVHETMTTKESFCLEWVLLLRYSVIPTGFGTQDYCILHILYIQLLKIIIDNLIPNFRSFTTKFKNFS